MIRLGILGFGNMGTGHAKNIIAGKCPEIGIAAVCDLKQERLDAAKEMLGDGVRYFTDAIKMLDSSLIDACLVAIPHYDHAKYAIECMKRSIHVMVEKPAGVYTLQAREMNAEADRHPEVSFGMMFNQRTNHIYRKTRELVKSGEFGAIRRTIWIITNWYRPQAYFDSGDWRATWSGEGGGVLLNQCPHNLDLWQWICGMPVKVSAKMKFGKWHDIEVEDDVSTYVEYANGATGVFITSTGDAHGTNRLEIQMDKARLITDGKSIQLKVYDMTEQEFDKINTQPFKTVPAQEVPVETDGENPQHSGVLNAWAGNILRGTPLIADGREGINGLMLSNAMHLSAFLGKEVDVPIDENLYLEELKKRIATSRRKVGTKSVFADTADSFNGAK